jgi:hypothetical protein
MDVQINHAIKLKNPEAKETSGFKITIKNLKYYLPIPIPRPAVKAWYSPIL